MYSEAGQALSGGKPDRLRVEAHWAGERTNEAGGVLSNDIAGVEARDRGVGAITRSG